MEASIEEDSGAPAGFYFAKGRGPASACAGLLLLLICSRAAAVPPPIDTRFGPADWESMGPAPATNGQVTIPPFHPVTGAIQAIAPHPADPNTIYIGAVNGGVWRTVNAASTNIVWTPLTDQEDTLSIGALVLDTADPSFQTLVAGIGVRSSLNTGGELLGLLRSADAGASWTPLGREVLRYENICGVAARGNLILAASDNQANNIGKGSGLFRSADGGANFTLISGAAGSGLPPGSVTSLARDPSQPLVLYACARGQGIYRTADFGLTWVNVSAGIPALVRAPALSMAAFGYPGVSVVYAATLEDGLSEVFRSVNGGVSWTAMDPAYSKASEIHHSMAADPVNPNLVYFGGETVICCPAAGNILRLDAGRPSGDQTTFLTDRGNGDEVPGTAPHTDSRDLAFTADGNLIEADDGGLYLLSGPSSSFEGVPPNSWRSLIGNLQTMEMHSIAWDSLANTLLAGTQDNSWMRQSAAGQLVWEVEGTGDGGVVAVDNLSIPGYSIRYASDQYLFGFVRETWNAAGQRVQSERIFPRVVSGEPFGFQYITPFVLNAIRPERILFGASNGLYESRDRGDTLAQVSSSPVDTRARMVYGGWLNGAPDEELIYAPSGSEILVRFGAGESLHPTADPFPGGMAGGVAAHPANAATACAIGEDGVFMTDNGGASWISINGNLSGAGNLNTLEILNLPSGAWLAVGADRGVYLTPLDSNRGSWTRLGSRLPNAPVFDLRYDATDSILAAATLGRGAWVFRFGAGSRLAIRRDAGGGILLSWAPAAPGQVLQAAPAVTGPWSDVPGATNGLRIQPSGEAMFYRLRQQPAAGAIF